MTSIADLPEHLQHAIRAELRPGERIVWLAQPDPRLTFKAGRVIWGFFVPWLIMSLVGAANMLPSRLNTVSDLLRPSVLFILLTVLIGVAGLGAPLWFQRVHRQTVYLITDARALILACTGNPTIESFFPEQLRTIGKQFDDHGRGDIVLRADHQEDKDGDQRTLQIGFLMIEHAAHPYYLLARLAGAQPDTAAPARAG